MLNTWIPTEPASECSDVSSDLPVLRDFLGTPRETIFGCAEKFLLRNIYCICDQCWRSPTKPNPPANTLPGQSGTVSDPGFPHRACSWPLHVGWTCLVSSCAQRHAQGWGCLSAPRCLASGRGGGNGPGCQVLPFPAALGSSCCPQTPESSCPVKHSDFKNLKVRCVKVQPNSGNAIVLKVVGIQICFAWQGLFGVQSVLGEKVYGNWRVPSEKKWHYSDEKNAIWLFRLSFWLWGTLTVWEEWVGQFHCCRIWKSIAGDPNCVRSS